MRTTRIVLAGTMATLLLTSCGGYDSGQPPAGPTPPPGVVTANAYILAGAQTLGPLAFGDEPVVIFKGERLRWVNLDNTTHALVADTTDVPPFRKTNDLAPGGEQSFTMTATGTTTFHCSIHPAMVGTLIVRER